VEDLDAIFADWKEVGIELVSEIGEMGAVHVCYARP
jgi:hypothetical protein